MHSCPRAPCPHVPTHPCSHPPVVLGEFANFAAYAFAQAILVTPLGALSIIRAHATVCELHVLGWLLTRLKFLSPLRRPSQRHTSALAAGREAARAGVAGWLLTHISISSPPPIPFPPIAPFAASPSAILAHMLLDEKLHVLGWLGATLCVVGSIAIVLHTPQEMEIDNVKQLWALATEPGYGSMGSMSFVNYSLLMPCVPAATAVCPLRMSLCELPGGELQGPRDCREADLSLDMFNTAMVTPIYYVMFTTLTIVASVIMYKDWAGKMAEQVLMEFCGFLTILIGTYLLHATKDFAGDSSRLHLFDPSARTCSPFPFSPMCSLFPSTRVTPAKNPTALKGHIGLGTMPSGGSKDGIELAPALFRPPRPSPTPSYSRLPRYTLSSPTPFFPFRPIACTLSPPVLPPSLSPLPSRRALSLSAPFSSPSLSPLSSRRALSIRALPVASLPIALSLSPPFPSPFLSPLPSHRALSLSAPFPSPSLPSPSLPSPALSPSLCLVALSPIALSPIALALFFALSRRPLSRRPLFRRPLSHRPLSLTSPSLCPVAHALSRRPRSLPSPREILCRLVSLPSISVARALSPLFPSPSRSPLPFDCPRSLPSLSVSLALSPPFPSPSLHLI
ncbi:unnamed protein product [Closterium sp. NIES-65]|nr:unnamed protein product [Closterium sp. NIES-65]